MWGLREQIKELRAALERVASLSDMPYPVRLDWVNGALGDINAIAKAALDKR